MRNLRLPATSLLVTLAVGAMPAAGQAEPPPHWYAEGKLVGSEPIPVKGKGGLGLSLSFSEFYGCNIRDRESISNPTGGGAGIGEMLTVSITACESGRMEEICGVGFQAIPQDLPWHSHLVREASNEVVDVIEGAALEIRCKRKKRSLGVFSGMLFGSVTSSKWTLLFSEERNILRKGSEHLYFSGGVVIRGRQGHKKISAA